MEICSVWEWRGLLESGKNIEGTESSGCWKARMSFGNDGLVQRRVVSYTRLGIAEVSEGYILDTETVR